jgi:hypothetical protein
MNGKIFALLTGRLIALTLISAAGLLFFFAVPANAQHAKSPRTKTDNSSCTDCHSCKNPTAENPCLIVCPRPRVTKRDLDKGPNEILLNELENEYDPVIFKHRRHATMSGMSGECADCHHFSEGGRIGSCKDCHPLTEVTDMKQPSLKGAYHRQCMKCHQEWSGVTSCEMCHTKKATVGEPSSLNTGSDIPTKRFFPPMEAPDKKVWQSTYKGGTVVTFFHNNHATKYGIDCALCHHAEGCGSCHRKGTTTQQVRHSEEALHGICNSCHAEMSCEQCHLAEEAKPFTHDRTGWPLGKHHGQASCRNCHGDPRHFKKPSPECNNCHSAWTTSNFDHARTGFVLNEVHRDTDCVSCHTNRVFSKPPMCIQCHEADFTFPTKMPGEYAAVKK